MRWVYHVLWFRIICIFIEIAVTACKGLILNIIHFKPGFAVFVKQVMLVTAASFTKPKTYYHLAHRCFK